MQNIFERLIRILLDRNEHFSYNQAQALVEILWEDTEATYAKVGKYNGHEMTEKVVRTWIESHGRHLHQIIANNKKYHAVLGVEDIKH